MGSVQMIIRTVPAHLSLDEAPTPTTTEGVSSLGPPPQAVFSSAPSSLSELHRCWVNSPRVSMLLGVGPWLQVQLSFLDSPEGTEGTLPTI